MPTIEQVYEWRKKAFEESMAIIAKKGHDYNRMKQPTDDTLFNIRVSYLLGVVRTPAASALVRLGDKIMRLISLIAEDAQEPANADERVWDTVLDAHNYLDYAFILWLEREGKL